MHKTFLFLVLFFATSIMADEINWAKDFDSGIIRAKKENKPVLFVFSKHTCRYCIQLENTTFSDKEVIYELNKNFVSIIAYSDDNDAMPKELWKPGTPSIWFLKTNAKPMFQAIMGAVDTRSFLKAMKIVKEEFKKKKKRVK